MNADLPARIAANVATIRANLEIPSTYAGLRNFIVAACDHADKVLARHVAKSNGVCENCPPIQYPCPEVRDLALMWLGEGWDQ